jgi:hypothetical protein
LARIVNSSENTNYDIICDASLNRRQRLTDTVRRLHDMTIDKGRRKHVKEIGQSMAEQFAQEDLEPISRVARSLVFHLESEEAVIWDGKGRESASRG